MSIRIGLPSIRTHRLTQKIMSHSVDEAKAPQGKHMAKRQAPEVPQVSTRDADDNTVATTTSAAPLADMTQNPCDFPLAPILAHQHMPYVAHHYCGCLTASVDTVGMCRTCDETLAAITPTSTDTDDEDDYLADNDISYERHDALANALEAPTPPQQAEHVAAMTDALGDAQLEDSDSDDLPKHIEGSASMRTALHALIKRHRKLFRRSVAKEPARLEPFTLKLKEGQTWTTSRKNHGSPRPLTPEKAAALKSQIDKLVELGVLKECQAGHYSHAHLVPKKPSGWRFTCDFRELNDNCESMRAYPEHP